MFELLSPVALPAEPNPQRLRLTLEGLVQGVGFRPFVYSLACQLGLEGWVANTLQGVTVELEGSPTALTDFLQRLPQEKPPNSRLDRLDLERISPLGLGAGFRIMAAGEGPVGAVTARAMVLPDLATCGACVAELWQRDDRRYLYPFINCTHCGPRYSIIHQLPYDRRHTTMERFTLCDRCAQEYQDPGDRRFHAQPNACPVCGPRLRFYGPPRFAQETGSPKADLEWDPARVGEGFPQTLAALGRGDIMAVKGLGGFHLMVDACQPEAVDRLRQRKRRPHKPLGVMFADREMLRDYCQVLEEELGLLLSAEAPLVLVLRRDQPLGDRLPLAPGIAPDNPYVAAMLPHTPLQHLLMAAYPHPLVATSGNLSGDPLCWRTGEAITRLGGIGDGILSHDRSIARPVDDSLVRWVAGRPLLLRRGRGYAPLPLTWEGGQVQFAIQQDDRVTNSQDNHTTNSQDNHTTNSQDDPVTNSQDNHTTNSQDDPVTNSQDNYTTNSQDNYTTNSQDNHTTNSQDDRVTNSQDNHTINSQDNHTTNSQDDPVTNSQDDRPTPHFPTPPPPHFPTPPPPHFPTPPPPHSPLPHPPILAVGGHLKNTLALYHQGQIILSPHIGDLDTLATWDRFQETLTTLQRLYDCHPEIIVCDAHPDYGSTQLAQRLAPRLAPPGQPPLPLIPVQHHYAHLRAVMAEHGLGQQGEPVLGVIWDGTGYGSDGTLWGGEFLLVEPGQGDRPPVTPGHDFQRVGHWRSFPLVGGDRAAREPRRSALGLWFAHTQSQAPPDTILEPQALPAILQPQFTAQELRLLGVALHRRVNCPYTSSVGRLFDGVAALLNLHRVTTFEGQGAMAVEFAALRVEDPGSYGVDWMEPEPGSEGSDRPWVLDWEPLLEGIQGDWSQGIGVDRICRRFHNTLLDGLLAVAQRVGVETVALGGGCFQNRLLLEGAIHRLQKAGFQPHWPHHFPPNDGGLALGQVAAVLARGFA